jgi:hypothetical protein
MLLPGANDSSTGCFKKIAINNNLAPFGEIDMRELKLPAVRGRCVCGYNIPVATFK